MEYNIDRFMNLEVDPNFEDFVRSLDPKHWARYDLSAVRLGWEARKQFEAETKEK